MLRFVLILGLAIRAGAQIVPGLADWHVWWGAVFARRWLPEPPLSLHNNGTLAADWSQRRLFGDSVDTTGYANWWSYIPHFAGVPGYVYAYAYGFLFSLAIFRKYEQEGDEMVEPYLALLRAGGSRSPEDLARIVGLDLTDPAIWASGIDALADDLDEAERLAAEIGLGT